MIRILSFQRNRQAFVASVTRVVAFGTTVAVTLLWASPAPAQQNAQSVTTQQLIPTASGLSDTPVSDALAVQYKAPPTGAENQVNDAGYSVLNDSSQVAQAQYGVGPQGLLSHHRPLPDPCNPGCDVSHYFSVDAMYMRREGDRYFSQSRNFFMPDFDFEPAGRFTAGTLFDCVNGFEVSYVGPFEWNSGLQVAGAGNLNSTLVPVLGYTANDIDAFNNADFQSQTWRVNMQSIEANRRWWVWDVFSTMIGARFIDYEEDYAFYSTGAAGTGLQVESVDNQYVGVQIGADMLYPASLRMNWGMKGRLGLYGNFTERRSFLNNDGTLLVNAGANDVDWGGQLELGFFGQYAIVPSVRLKAGYDLWWLARTATIPEQSPSIISPGTGSSVFNKDDVVIHGGWIGAEVLF